MLGKHAKDMSHCYKYDPTGTWQFHLLYIPKTKWGVVCFVLATFSAVQQAHISGIVTVAEEEIGSSSEQNY